MDHNLQKPNPSNSFTISRLKKVVLLVVFTIILLALPVTILLNRQTQDLRQQAAQACEDSPADIVLAIDASPSMLQEEKFVKAKAAASSFIDTSAQNTENKIALVAYSNPISTSIMSPFSSNFTTLKTTVNNLTTVGGTCISCAVQKVNQAISDGKRSGYKNVAILLTDGQANQITTSTPYTTVTADIAEAEALEFVKQGFDQNNTVFFTIGLGSNQIDPVAGTGVNEAFLQEIASSTGGKYYHAPTGDQLNEIYQEISTIAGKGIISGFVYNDADRNGEHTDTEEKLQNWQVTLEQNGATVETQNTDDNGSYSFTGLCDGQFTASITVQQDWEATQPQDGTIQVLITQGSAENETNFGVAARVAACGSTCSTNSECTSASDGCTLCNTSTNQCEKPASCGSQCTNSSDCANATDSCTSCNPGTNQCEEPKTCGSVCTQDSDCANATGGCNVCNPTTNTCQTAPSCGSTCTQDSECAATTDSCTVCNQSTNTCAPQPEETVLKVQAKMPGIGGQSGDNQNPQNPTRNAVIEIYNTQNQLVNDGSGTAQFQGENYVGEVSLGEDFTPGVYYAKIGFNNTLVSRVPQVHNLQKGIINELPAITLIPGDLNQNNILDLFDYNIFISCFGDKTCEQKTLADLNDDGEVEGIDYNILLRSFRLREGSGFTGPVPTIPPISPKLTPTTFYTGTPTPTPFQNNETSSISGSINLPNETYSNLRMYVGTPVDENDFSKGFASTRIVIVDEFHEISISSPSNIDVEYEIPDVTKGKKYGIWAGYTKTDGLSRYSEPQYSCSHDPITPDNGGKFWACIVTAPGTQNLNIPNTPAP